VTHLSGPFELRDHDAICWATPSDLASLSLTEPDRLLAARLKKKGVLQK
jgi:hypothetical protein